MQKNQEVNDVIDFLTVNVFKIAGVTIDITNSEECLILHFDNEEMSIEIDCEAIRQGLVRVTDADSNLNLHIATIDELKLIGKADRSCETKVYDRRDKTKVNGTILQCEFDEPEGQTMKLFYISNDGTVNCTDKE